MLFIILILLNSCGLFKRNPNEIKKREAYNNLKVFIKDPFEKVEGKSLFHYILHLNVRAESASYDHEDKYSIYALNKLAYENTKRFDPKGQQQKVLFNFNNTIEEVIKNNKELEEMKHDILLICFESFLSTKVNETNIDKLFGLNEEGNSIFYYINIIQKNRARLLEAIVRKIIVLEAVDKYLINYNFNKGEFSPKFLQYDNINDISIKDLVYSTNDSFLINLYEEAINDYVSKEQIKANIRP